MTFRDHATSAVFAKYHNRPQERVCQCGAKFVTRSPQGKYCDACRGPERKRKHAAYLKRGAK